MAFGDGSGLLSTTGSEPVLDGDAGRGAMAWRDRDTGTTFALFAAGFFSMGVNGRNSPGPFGDVARHGVAGTAEPPTTAGTGC